MNQSKDEKVQSLLRERRMLEQRLEEAHLHLADIKGTWSAQNMALETQVDRLSRQVAAETTEKRKALKIQDESAERLKQMAFQLENAQSEIEQRDQKVNIDFHTWLQSSKSKRFVFPSNFHVVFFSCKKQKL